MNPAPNTPTNTPSNTPNTAGFNLIGYATSPMGLGEDLRTFAALLEHLAIPFSMIDIPTESSGKIDIRFKQLCATQFATSIFFMSPMECEKIAKQYPPLFTQPKTKIGFFLWELPDFPDQYLPALKLVDQIWCPTKFVQSSFMAKSKQLTLTIPLPVIQPVPSGRDFRKELGIPKEAFVALFMFDLQSTQNRKNPQGAVQAFMQFAQNKPDAYFVLKINRWQNMDRKALSWLPHDARIKLVTDTLKPAELSDLYHSANCYLSLHRSEGFGRTLVEALQHGLTLIATNYSGPADYITPQNTQIVEWLPQTVRKGDYPFNHFSMWADPIISQATSALQTLYQSERGKANADSIASGNAYTVENLAAKYRGVIASYLH